MRDPAATRHYQALWNDEPAPCDDCKFARKCAIEDLACSVFFNYVNTRYSSPLKERIPTVGVYRKLFATLDRINIRFARTNGGESDVKPESSHR